MDRQMQYQGNPKFAILFLCMVLSACTSDPAYAPPTNDEAKSAVIAGIHADLIDGPIHNKMPDNPAVGPGDDPISGMKKVGGSMASLSELNDRADAQSDIDSLLKIEIGVCDWGSVDPDNLQAYGKERLIQGKISEAYTCTYEMYSDTSTRGQVSAKGRGYFYKASGGYFHADIERSSWEEVRTK
jgi:hypothetical protein